eukprot:TRINITY_DN15743_c3_g1_i1.p1 TRINITY_DN15743_c3_g1~~TRINITY_DN15743_c3_g1_i1.p1  ORF type:complete len:759 (-),score=119.11 TRINITY_DN15743_c3_g1_i1:77-2131(-)
MDAVLIDHMQGRVDSMRYISGLIADGADSFLLAQYRYLAPFVLLLWILVSTAVSVTAGIAYLVGSGTSAFAGYVGMKIATYSNSRTTQECWRSLGDGYLIAMRGGCIASFILVSLGMLNLYVLAFVFASGNWDGDDIWMKLVGYGFGACSIALFSRVGGGIYTKAADIGADLSGKVDFGLAEDDYNNPACIADNVGDNVGGIVGIGADLFGSLCGAICVALVLAGRTGGTRGESGDDCEVGTSIAYNWRAMMFPLVMPSASILVGMLTLIMMRYFYKVRDFEDVQKALKGLVVLNAVVMTPVILLISTWCLPASFVMSCDHRNVRPVHCAAVACLGLWAGVLNIKVTEYYTSYQHGPVKEIAKAHEMSAATGVILGLAVGYVSCTAPICSLAFVALVSNSIAGTYGIAIAALGMLSSMPLCLAIAAYDSIADNAGGISEMAGLSTDVRDRTEVLVGAGAIGNGFAMGAAALTTVALIHAFWKRSELQAEATDQWFATGLLLGASLPYTFSATTMKRVGAAANDMIAECRRQFEPIIQNNAKPDYDRCITIATKASLKVMGPAGLLVIGSPIVVDFLFGKKCSAGLLQGVLASGVQMAVSMIHSGGAWDNAKKFVFKSGHKGSEQCKNAVIGDIVGDPLKDVTGPSLNVLLTMSAITSLLFADRIGQWSGPDGGPFLLKYITFPL